MSHNSSKRFDQPLVIELAPSRQLLLACLALYLSAALLCLWARLSFALQVLLALHFCYVYCIHIGMCLPMAIRAVSWDAVRGWRIRQARGDWLPAEPMLPVFVSYRLVALRFRCGRLCYRSLLVMAQRCAADDFRRLRVRLIQSAHGDRNRAKISGA
jgi:signal transduction histidine kinase